jgi:hypothetical protein
MAVEFDQSLDEALGVSNSMGKPSTVRMQKGALHQNTDNAMGTRTLNIDTAERQRLYVEIQKQAGGGTGIVFQEAFINGMRDLGYKDPGWAISELTDNSVQGGATRIEIRFGYDKKSNAKPNKVAVIDNGNGMISDMITYAVRWGGSDRINDRNGMGRFGYGLPSSCVSLGRQYTVYSKTNGDVWHKVRVSIDELAAAASDVEKTNELLKPIPEDPPEWLSSIPENGVEVPTLESGTVIVIEELDRLNEQPGWVTTKSMKDKLVKHLGLIYRYYIPDIAFVVDGRECEPIDPLFLMPHGRFFDETPVMAQHVDTRVMHVETPSGMKGDVRIRASILPPTFGFTNPNNPNEKIVGRNGGNGRWKIFGDQALNGIIVCREGRQIDVVPPSWTKFQNYDLYLKIELDFDAALDELFKVATSKQQIRFNEFISDKLTSPGKNGGRLAQLVSDMRRELEKQRDDLQARKKSSAVEAKSPLPSGQAMIEAERITGKRAAVTPEDEKTAEANMKLEIDKEVKATGENRSDVEEKVKQRVETRDWDVQSVNVPEGWFFRPVRLGSQKRIELNTEHPFYKYVYNNAPEAQPGIELLLFVLAKGELDSIDTKRKFYQVERATWSQMLRIGLDALTHPQEYADQQSAVMEAIEMEGSESPEQAQ